VIQAREMFSLSDDAVHNGFDWPSPGRITGIYGSQRILNGKPRQPHYGIDIAAAQGTPVIASADGVIAMATDLYFTGGTIIIDHGYYLNSTYSHLKTMTVAAGDTVSRGQVIGTVGSTGRSTGPHLDWRINWGATRLDPMLLSDAYVPSLPAARPVR
jgi:murein DD-endopeptidase MepM/ murein hydrolase activator NlpD